MLTAYTRRKSSLVCALAPPNGALATIAIKNRIAARIIDLDTARMWHRLFHTILEEISRARPGHEADNTSILLRTWSAYVSTSGLPVSRRPPVLVQPRRRSIYATTGSSDLAGAALRSASAPTSLAGRWQRAVMHQGAG